jgi:hypothetical protein
MAYSKAKLKSNGNRTMDIIIGKTRKSKKYVSQTKRVRGS